MDQIKIMVVFC